MPRGPFQYKLLPVPHPHGKPLTTHTSTGDPPTLAGSFGSVSCGVTAPFPWVLECTTSQSGVSASPPSCGSLVIKPTGLQGQIPWRFPVPLLDPQAGKPDMRLRNFTTVGELCWYYCTPDCGSPSQWVWDLILSCLHPSYHLVAASFVFGHGLSFFGGLQYPLVNGCSTASCDFGALAGGDEHTSFYSSILNWMGSQYFLMLAVSFRYDPFSSPDVSIFIRIWI